MRAVLLLLCLSFPAAAQAPSLDELMKFYVSAGWLKANHNGQEYVCISRQGSDFVDAVVTKLYERAKGVTCS